MCNNCVTTSLCRAIQTLRCTKDAALHNCHAKDLRIATLKHDLEKCQRECDSLGESYAESLQRARQDLNAELAAVRRDANEARRGAAQSAVLQRQAERDVRLPSLTLP